MVAEKNGWIKLHRKMQDNPIIMKDADHLAIWVYLLLNATHAEYPALFKGQKIMLQPGQLITGRKSIAEQLKINESKVTRVLNAFESEQQIEQQTSNKNRLISLLNWDLYQFLEQTTEQQVNNNRTTTEQQVNTNKNVKNIKNDKNVINKDIYGEYRHVLLSDKEFEKLGKDFGEVQRDKAINFLDAYIEEKGYKSKSHNLAIRRWVIDAIKEKQGKQPIRKEPVPKWMPKNQNQYDFDALEDDLLANGTKTSGNDPELQARAEALKKKLGGGNYEG